MVKTIISITGDYSHEGRVIDHCIQRVVSLLDEAVIYENVPLDALADALSKNPDLVILSSENRYMLQQTGLSEWLTPEISTQITTYVAHGGSWLALHSGMSNYPIDSDYIQMLKGYFVRHPEPLAVTYKCELAEAPRQFVIHDEHYQVGFVDEFTNIFLRSFSDAGESVAGWRHFYGSGKVAGYVPAHNREGMLNQENLALLKTVVNWLLKHQSSVRWKQYLKE
ncbi:ThuA domain-containing protein [Pseudolactococcus yaeyamensis]